MTTEPVTPDPILQLGFGFWGSKALLSAVELGVFTTLADAPQTGDALIAKLGLQRRGTLDFLDALVSLGMLERTGNEYANTAATDLFLDRNKPSYVGGILEMANARLYPFWGSLTEALRTGHPQNEAKVGENFFAVLYQDPDRLKQFLHAMTGISMGAAFAIAERFPWDRYNSIIDIGTAEGCVPVQVALRHQHLTGGGFDLAAARPVFDDYVASFGLGDRLRFHPGDFFIDPLPSADVLVMGHILHDWSLEEKLMLLRKAYEALPDGGALIVYESIIDDERRANTFGLLMSVNMLIETQDGFDYTGADCQSWMTDIGFRDCYVEPLVGPDAMVVGIKQPITGYTGHVAASVTVGEYAAVVVVTDAPGAFDDVSVCHRDEEGWYEEISTGGRQFWHSTNEVGDRGLLCFWGRQEAGAPPFVVVDGDSLFTVTPEPSGYWVWAADDMPPAAMDSTEIRDL